MKNIINLSFLFAILVFATGSVHAQQYGQGSTEQPAPNYSISVDKLVSKGPTTKYVENYSQSDPRFHADERIYFLVKVKNTSSITLKNIEVEDKMPEWVAGIEGPGEYIANERVIRWKYNELAPGEERTEKLIAQVLGQNRLPSDRGLFCVSNKAWTRSGGAYDEDMAQFCIEKQVALTTKGGQPVTTTPDSGAPLLVYGLISLGGLGSGIVIKRKNS